jgi:hypothetical protein
VVLLLLVKDLQGEMDWAVLHPMLLVAVAEQVLLVQRVHHHNVELVVQVQTHQFLELLQHMLVVVVVDLFLL